MNSKQVRRKPTSVEEEMTARPDRLEAVAMRRIVVEMGYWLSPFMKNEPLPVLSEYERTVDLAELHRRSGRGMTMFETGASVLDRMDGGKPKKHSVYVNLPGRKALLAHERLTENERASMEETKEQRRREEIEAKKARMKDVEVSLRPVLSEEAKEQAKLRAMRQAAEGKAEEARRLNAEAAAARRLETINKTRQLEKERGRPSRAKEPNLAPSVLYRPAIEVAMEMPLDRLFQAHLATQMSSFKSRASREHRKLTEADLQAAAERFESKLSDIINHQADFLYHWQARVIEHSRLKNILKRETNRGTLTKEMRQQILAEHSPGKDKARPRGLSVEEKTKRRMAKKAEYNKAWRAKQKTKQENQ